MKLITKEIEQAFRKYPLYSQDGKEEKAVLAKFFGGSSYTFYVVEAEPYGADDWTLYGYTQLFEGEWGYTMWSDIRDAKFPPFNLGLERDLSFTPGKYVIDQDGNIRLAVHGGSPVEPEPAPTVEPSPVLVGSHGESSPASPVPSGSSVESEQSVTERNLSVFRSVIAKAGEPINKFNADEIIQQLSQFCGWGQCADIINNRSKDYKEVRNALSSLYSDEQTMQAMSTIQSSTLTSFYTPVDVANAITESVLYAFRRLSGRFAHTLLEPSAGTGNFLRKLPDALMPLQYPFEVTTCEKEPITNSILSVLKQCLNKKNANFTFPNSYNDFVKLSLEEKFDVIVSNIPFGQVPVNDPEMTRRVKAGELPNLYTECQYRIHNYYFLKSTQLLNDGGILAFITSRGFLSADSNRQYREEMMRHGNAIAIIRLPDNLFPTVNVGSDLIVFQRCQHVDSDLNKLFVIGMPEESADFNGQLCKLPDTKLTQKKNQYGKMVYHYGYDKSKIAKHLCLTLGNILSNAPVPSGSTVEPSHDAPAPSTSPAVSPATSKPRCPISKQPRRPVSKAPVHGGSPIEPSPAAPAAPVAKTPAPIGSAAGSPKRPVSKAPAATPQAYFSTAYSNLKAAYDILIAHWTDEQAKLMLRIYYSVLGTFNGFAGRLAFTSLHQALEAYGSKLTNEQRNFIASLEVNDGTGNYIPADVFFQDITANSNEHRTDLTPQEALAASLNMKGCVDMDYMQQRTSLDMAGIASELKDQIFLNPITMQYEEADRWLTGNVVKKAKEATEAMQQLVDGQREAAEHAVAALIAARPAVIPFEDMDVQLGARWVPNECYIDFAAYVFDCPESRKSSLELYYIPTNDTYVGTLSNYYCNKWRYEWKVKEKQPGEMVLAAIQGKTPEFTMKDPNDYDKRIPDNEANALAIKVVSEIRREWKEYVNMPEQHNLRHLLQDIYNERFNNEVRPHYDGSFQTFPDLCLRNLGINELYPSQKDAVWMIKRNRGGVCWHEVGTGKTLIMCIAAYEMKRLGLVNKPMIIGLKANIAQIADTFRKAYPNARVLFPKAEEWSKESRIDLFNSIRNNDWDCIIMTHDQFGRIPAASRTEMQLMSEELFGLSDMLNDIDDKAGWMVRRQLHGLQRRRENLQIKLSEMKLQMQRQKDEVMDFADMGIDHIFVDESHYFKNLQFTTKSMRVAGIGNPAGSQRAWKLLTAIRDIQYRKGADVCSTFMSGTIVSNSLTELYVIFKYLRPRALAERDIHSFDAWAAVFTEITNDFELNVVGQVHAKERFAAYINLPELGQFFRQITDYRTSTMCGIDAPKMQQHFECAPPTPQQQVMLQRLVRFVDQGNWNVLGIKRDEPANLDKALMLIATDLARKTSLDPRMLDDCKTFTDEPTNKLHRCAANIFRIYEETKPQLGTQFVFTDISTVNDDCWNMQRALRDTLVMEYGIPSMQIAFINDATTDNKRLQLFKDANDGKVRIIIGSTQKLGTGVNAQQRAVAVHHLDIPWRPSDLEQRNGRALRQGNFVAKQYRDNKVDVFIYATERTLDSYKFNLLKNKQTFIDQLNNGTLGIRRIDDSILQDGDKAVSYAEFLSLISGNEDLLTKSKLDAKIMQLEKERSQFNRQRNQTVETIHRYEAENKAAISWIKNAKADILAAASITADTLPVLEGLACKDFKEAGRSITELANKHVGNGYKEFGTIGMFKLAVFRPQAEGTQFMPRAQFYVVGPSGQYYSCYQQGSTRSGNLIQGTLEQTAHYPHTTISDIHNLLDKKQEELNERLNEMPSLQDFVEKKWDGDAELANLYQQRDEVTQRIAKQAASAEKNADAA